MEAYDKDTKEGEKTSYMGEIGRVIDTASKEAGMTRRHNTRIAQLPVSVRTKFGHANCA